MEAIEDINEEEDEESQMNENGDLIQGMDEELPDIIDDDFDFIGKM